jgi:hypothetical protein
MTAPTEPRAVLQSCPFCGGEPHVLSPVYVMGVDSDEPDLFSAGCVKCQIWQRRPTKDDTIAAWNARASAEQAAGGVERVREALHIALIGNVGSLEKLTEWDKGYRACATDLATVFTAAPPAQPSPVETTVSNPPPDDTESGLSIKSADVAARALTEALRPFMPIETRDGPDYAEVTFGDHKSQAMTMVPADWNKLAAAYEAVRREVGMGECLRCGRSIGEHSWDTCSRWDPE